MAVEIPVIIDIEGAFEKAAKDVSKAMKPLQDELSRKTLNLNVPQVGKLKDILKSTTISADDLADAMAHIKGQMELLNVRGGFLRGGKMTKEAQQLTAAYAALEAKLKGGANAVEQAINGTLRLGSATNETTNAMKAQIPVLGQITAGLGAYLSVHSLVRFAKQIRDITGELEYQRVALQHLLQDEQYGAELFERIKVAAVESPFRIKDLVTYTKQLAAYRIETVKLFDTTKRLADISAGLGVDMNRLILAYGQVRAASVLRGQELRQFTEAGIPLVELLAEKFTELEGRLVSTGEVFKRISERAVPFAMISDIFEDLTDKGGMFYEMQERQAKTLQGRWEKLKDQFDIALQTIGDSKTFQRWNDEILWGLNLVAKNLRIIPKLLTAVTRGWIVYNAAALIASMSTTKAAVAQGKLTVAEKKQLKLLPAITIKILGQATATKIATKAMIGQRTATTGAARAFWKLTAAMLANPVGAIAAAFAGLATIFLTFRKKTQDVDEGMKELDETIEGAGQTLSGNRRMDALIDRYGRLAQKTNRTAKENQTLAQTMMTLQSRFTNYKLSLDATTASIPEQVKKLKELNKKQKEQAEALLKTAKANIELELSKKEPKQKALTARYIQQSQDRQYFLNIPESQRTNKQKRAIKTYNKEINKTETELNAVNEEVNALYRRLASIDELLNPTPTNNMIDNAGDRLRKLRSGISDLTDAYKKYIELLRYESKAAALADIGVLFPSLKGAEPSYEYVSDFFNKLLQRYKGDAEATRVIEQSFANFRFDKIKSDLDNRLKKLSDDMKRSETARNFFQNILNITGDEDLAATMTVSVYGGIGDEFKERMQHQLNAALAHIDTNNIDLWTRIWEAGQKQDFSVILANLDKFPDEWQKRLKQMAEDSQKFQADREADLIKALQGAKSYADKAVEINRKAQQRLAQIDELKADDATKERLRKQSADKEASELQQLQYEAFKETPMYIELFANLDTASERMLKSMRQNLVQMKSEWKDLTPTELKELQSRIEELDAQIASRNPFKALISSIKEYRDMTQNLSRREAEEAAISATDYANLQKESLQAALDEYNLAVKTYGVNSDEAALAKDKLDVQKEETDEAIETADAAQKTANAYREVAQHIVEATKQMEEWVGYMNELGNSAKDLVSSFASDEDATFFSQQFDSISKAISGTAGLASGIAGAIANPADISSYVKAIKGVVDIIVGINDYFTGNKIKKAEDNIKSQQQALDDLAYAYDRLENSMKDAFGSDYISKYTQQLEILAAEQKAYEEQARAERNKGKKADEDKIKEYENKARDTANEIAEMQGKLAEYFTGTDVTSAARDFANAWIEAYREFGSTTDAMKEKFQDMIQNMITESLAAKLMQSILEPLFQEIDDLAEEGGELSAADIAKIASDSTGYIDRINAAMTTLMNQLTAAGYNVRDKASQFTGIARDIAGASEESITGLAAGINTQNFYMMHIDQQVAAILATLTGGSVATADGSQVVLDPYKEQMLAYAAYLPMMHDNVAAMRSLLDKVIRPIGTSSNYRMIIG